MAVESFTKASSSFILDILKEKQKIGEKTILFLKTVETAFKHGDYKAGEKALRKLRSGDADFGNVMLDITNGIINKTTTGRDEVIQTDLGTPSSIAGHTEILNSIKKEPMPPPAELPPRKRKVKKEPVENEPIRKSSRTRKITSKLAPNDDRSSDIIIQERPVSTVDLTNGEQSICVSGNRSMRSTRSKTANKKQKEAEKNNEESENDKSVCTTRTKREKKRSKSKTPEKEVGEQIEDVHMSQQLNATVKETTTMNATFVKDKNDPNEVHVEKVDDIVPSTTRTTMVVNNSKLVKKQPEIINTEKMNGCVLNSLSKTTKAMAEVFSPFNKTPVKNKVNAYEELIKKQNTPLSKVCTPTSSKLPIKTGSTSQLQRIISGKTKTSATRECNSAMKASLAEIRERERRRKEKEQEASKKKEALLQAQMEEKRKKREEKQLKAQLHREQIEKERNRSRIEQLSKVEEISKKGMAAKEEKIRKYKEEQERKRHLAKERFAQNAPIYLRTPLPVLPTDSPYDTDDERYVKPAPPAWSKDRISLLAQCYVPQKVKNTFFCRSTYTADLRELFEVVDEKQLKRNSSAIWKTEPNYSMLYVTQDCVDNESNSD